MQYTTRLWQILACTASLLYNEAAFSQVCPISEINVSGGYRNDTYKTTNTTKTDSDTTTQVDTIDVHNVHIGQVGVNGRLMMPDFEVCCLNNFFLSGFAYWGWNGHCGGLHEHVVSHTGAGELTAKAKLKKAGTRDFQLGLGYLFDWNEWNIGLSAGYAYDRQNIATKSGKIAFPSGSTFIDAPLYGSGYETTTKWEGPWIGTSLEYNECWWRFGAGYELHFADYSANHTIPDNFQARLQGVGSTIHSSQAYGNVAFVDADYRFCDGWKLGAAFAYQYWQANHGHLKSEDFILDGIPTTTKVNNKAKWSAYSIILNLGCAF